MFKTNNQVKVLSLCLVLSTPGLGWSKSKVVYGVDNRVGIEEIADANIQSLARATAAQIEWSRLSSRGASGAKKYSYENSTLMDELRVCQNVRFAKEPAIARCSGFLVAPNLLVTAGHCVDEDSCGDNAWVFDYRLDKVKSNSFDAKQVYSCKRVVDRKFESAGSIKFDIALVELDRPVLDRKPLNVRGKGAAALGDEVMVIGHPSGLPTKVSAGAKILENHNATHFLTDLDTFGGNSGSAVINVKTGLVEGVLVRGAVDYLKEQEDEFFWEAALSSVEDDKGGQCYVVNFCDARDGENSRCNGEDVSRISQLDIKSYIKSDGLMEEEIVSARK